MGGEKPTPPAIPFNKRGSPPHGRGKDSAGSLDAVRVRITPAWAGKSLHENAAAAVPGDHPRVDGEKFPASVPPVYGPGSPPRGRGKVPRWGYTLYRHRDHPRVGGEKLEKLVKGALLIGSPPRGRGKGAGNGDLRLHDGITPAWAGKSWERTLPPSEPKDHPRVGGEKSEDSGPLHQPDRITPAWAGKSPASQPWSPPLWMMVIRPRP